MKLSFEKEVLNTRAHIYGRWNNFFSTRVQVLQVTGFPKTLRSIFAQCYQETYLHCFECGLVIFALFSYDFQHNLLPPSMASQTNRAFLCHSLYKISLLLPYRRGFTRVYHLITTLCSHGLSMRHSTTLKRVLSKNMRKIFLFSNTSLGYTPSPLHNATLLHDIFFKYQVQFNSSVRCLCMIYEHLVSIVVTYNNFAVFDDIINYSFVFSLYLYDSHGILYEICTVEIKSTSNKVRINRNIFSNNDINWL